MRSCAQTATLPLGGMQELDVCVVQIPRHPELLVDYVNCGGSLCHRCLTILAQQHLDVIAHTFPVAKPFLLVTEGKISRFDARDGADATSVVWQIPALICLRVYRCGGCVCTGGGSGVADTCVQVTDLEHSSCRVCPRPRSDPSQDVIFRKPAH